MNVINYTSVNLANGRMMVYYEYGLCREEKSSFIANAFVNGMANKYTESSRSRPQL